MDFSLVFLVALALTGAAHGGPVFSNNRAVSRSSELNDIFLEFAALVPQDKVVAIALEYLEKDAEVQAIAKYVQSEAFKDLVRKVESIEDVINFYDYLNKAGLDIYVAVNKLHEALGLPPLVPGNVARNVRITGGVAGLIADVKALLPLDKIKALYHEKLETSAAFADLVHHLQSPRFQELINSLRANAEFQKIVVFAKQHGVDVRAIVDLLTSALGLEFPESRDVARSAVKSSELNDIFLEFAALVPQDKVVAIALEYLEKDAEVQAVAKYVQSEAFKDLVRKVESIEDVINFYDYLNKAGLDIYVAVNKLHEALGLPPLVPGNVARNVRITGGVAGLIADVKALLPLDKIKALYHEKLETSAAFADLVHHLQSPRFQELINSLRANAEFQKIVAFAKEHGVDVRAIVDLLSSALGLEFPTSRAIRSSELHQVFEEFLALMPVEKFHEIVLDYVKNDAEVQAVVQYLESDAFKNFVLKAESIEDVINFYDYLDKAGLDIYGAVNGLHTVIGLPPLVPGGHVRHIRSTGGVAGLIADIKAILPVDKIKALYHEKLETSPAFAQLVAHFQSPKFQQLINRLRANEEFQKMLSFAKQHGVDVGAIVDLLSSMLGLEFPKSRAAERASELNDIFLEFAALIPQDKVIAIALEYLEKDAEVQAVVEYVQSEAFKDLVRKVESIEDVINFYDSLDKAGLDIYVAVNKLHAALGLPPLVPGNFARNVRITGGVAGLIADVKALLPLDKIKALYHEKLETSKAFADLVAHFQSPRFQELINALRANKEFRQIVAFAKAHGIDVEAIVDLLSTALGLEFPESRVALRSSELNEIFLEFAALVPVEKVIAIAQEYLEKDAEVQHVVEYIQTEAFKDLIRKIESIEDVINFYNFLDKAGLDVYVAVNQLHEALGLPPLVPGNFARNVRITGGVAGLIADVKATLPLDKIKALYHKKLETSKAFADLIAHFQSPRFQELINALRANKEFRQIVAYAKEHGIDIAALTDLLTTLLGLEFPESRAVARSSELNEIFLEFAALVPVEKVVAIAQEYLEKDAEVQHVAEYIKTEAFTDLIRKIESIEDVINFYNFLDKAGLDIYVAVNKLHEAVGLPPLVPGNFARNVRITGGVAGLIADVKATLPLDKIKALYHEKLETSKAFADLVAHLQSPRFQELINALRANKEFRQIVAYAKEHGIDIAALTDLLTTLLGLEFPESRAVARSSELNEIFLEFAALVPVEKVMAIGQEYLEKDAEVQHVAEYIKTEAFTDLIRKIESIEDVINFYNFLDKAGLDIYVAVNKLHEAVGLPPLVPGNFARNVRITGGVAGLIADVKATLPLDKIKALYHEKLETSKAFADLVAHLQSPRFQELINALRANKEFRQIVAYAKEHGIDIAALTDLLTTLLGLEFPESRAVARSSELNEIFLEFAALVPVEKVMAIGQEYLEKDAEVQHVAEYIKTEAFTDLIRKIESIEDVINFYNFLDKAGLDIYVAVNKLHEAVGLPPLVPGNFARNVRITGGVAGLIADVKATLPLDKIKALYHEKLETSKAFADLVAHLQSPRFQELINALRANKEFRQIVAYAKEHGIDIAALTDLLTTMLGLEFPDQPRFISNVEINNNGRSGFRRSLYLGSQ